MAGLKFTLDTNCLYAISGGWRDAAHVRAPFRTYDKGRASVAFCAMSAAERQRDPMFIWDVTYRDNAILAEEYGVQLEAAIRVIHFPNLPPSWLDYCSLHSIDPRKPGTTHFRKWRNAMCDMQGYWPHINADRDVFITQDKNFLKSKKPAILALGGWRIETPEVAARIVGAGAGAVAVA